MPLKWHTACKVLIGILFLQVPTEMLRQVRYLNECVVKRLNQKNVQKALRQMQQQTEGQAGGKRDVSYY